MAWKDTLQDASFRGVKFDVQRTDDPIERNVARYAYPYVDGEDIEDLGQKARETSLTAIFFGDDYEDRLKKFLNALSQPGAGELVHPVFGSMPAMQFIGGHVAHNADDVDACTVELRFAKANPGNPFFTGTLTSQRPDATAQKAQMAQAASTSLFSKAVNALKTAKASLRQLNAIRDIVSETIGPLKNLVTGFQSTVLDYINFPGALAGDLVGLVSGVADFRSFDPGLVMSDWNSMFDQMDAIVKLPAGAASGDPVTIPGTPNTPAAPAGGSGSTNSTGTPPSSAQIADPANVAIVTALTSAVVATTLASVASDVLANEIDTPTLTPDDIETISNDVRSSLQGAIDDARATEPLADYRDAVEALKDTALAVQQLAAAVIDQLPPIVSRTVDAPCNLTLLAFRWYDDYTRASELMRLNPEIRNPNFINRGDVLRGYAR